MTSLNLLLKPASGSCNLRCRYCFYADEAGKRETACYGLMTEETAEAVISKSLAAATDACHFGFQGGEPMLRGLAFYQKFMALCERHNARRIQTTFSIYKQFYGYAVPGLLQLVRQMTDAQAAR